MDYIITDTHLYICSYIKNLKFKRRLLIFFKIKILYNNLVFYNIFNEHMLQTNACTVKNIL